MTVGSTVGYIVHCSRVSVPASWRGVRSSTIHIYFTHLLHHGSDWLNTTPPPLCHPPYPIGLNLVTCNIRDGRGFRLPQAIRAVQIGNYNLILMTETKIPDVVYCHNYLRYDIVCSQAVVIAAGGVKGGGVTGHEGLDGGMDCIIHAVPWSEHGEIQNRFQSTAEPDYWSITSPVHSCSPYGY